MTDQSTALTDRPAKTGLTYAGVEMNALGGGAMMLPKTFGEVVAFSEMMSRSDIAVPKHLRNNPGACMAVTMRSLRWEMDPFAVASKTYLVNDQIAYEAQLVAAVVHTRAPIARRPDYAYIGEGETRQCIVSIEMMDGTTKTYESPKKKDIKVQNSPLWKADLDQQLGYYSIRSWGRRHTPEVLLGVYTPDELIDHRENMLTRTPEKSGLMARLATSGAAGGAGFSTEHVRSELGDTGHDPVTGEVIEGQATEVGQDSAQGGGAAEETITSDASGGQTPADQQAGEDDFPGSGPAPKTADADKPIQTLPQDGVKLLSWAADLTAELEGMDLEAIEGLLVDATAVANFTQLQQAHARAAENLDKAITARRTALGWSPE